MARVALLAALLLGSLVANAYLFTWQHQAADLVTGRLAADAGVPSGR